MRRLDPSTAYVVTFNAFLASDHVTPATGKTIAITISKAGAAYGNPSAGATNATEVASGLYKVTLSTTDTDTLGDLNLMGAVATIDTVFVQMQVATLTNAGLAADSGLKPIRTGTAQTGAAGSITLDASASAVTDFYEGAVIYLTGGTGAGQINMCTAYNGTSKLATVAQAWETTPDATTTFAIIPHGPADLQSILGVTAGTSSAQLGVNVINAAGVAWGSGAITAASIATGAIDADALAADAGTELAAAVAAHASIVAIKAKTDSLTFTVANMVDTNIQAVNDVVITGTGVETTDEWRPV